MKIRSRAYDFADFDKIFVITYSDIAVLTDVNDLRLAHHPGPKGFTADNGARGVSIGLIVVMDNGRHIRGRIEVPKGVGFKSRNFKGIEREGIFCGDGDSADAQVESPPLRKAQSKIKAHIGKPRKAFFGHFSGIAFMVFVRFGGDALYPGDGHSCSGDFHLKVKELPFCNQFSVDLAHEAVLGPHKGAVGIRCEEQPAHALSLFGVSKDTGR